jgi:hypothetical protein
MLEIGCNVVVLSLEEYEKLKRRAKDAEATVDKVKQAISFKKNWDGTTLEASICLTDTPEIVQKAWEQFKPDKYNNLVKEEFHLTDAADWWGSGSTYVGKVNQEPIREKEEE